MKNKTLILTATHGDEAFSIPVVQALQSTFKFDWTISNPKAFKQKTRFLEADLNRSGPGNSTSPVYEIRRAQKLIALGSKYQQTIDIHGTISNTGVFIILSDPNWRNIELAKKFDVQNVVLWPSLQPQGPLTQFIPNSLEIECGPKNNPATTQELNRVLSQFLSKKPRTTNQNYYIVSGFLPQSVNQPFQDFSPVTYCGLRFTPLLVDQYPGIKCYCLQQLNSPLNFNTSNTNT